MVYAIRNLTEDNSQNQDLIAKMEEQGLADASLLKKMGFEVEKRGDKLVLKATSTPPPVSMLQGGPPSSPSVGRVPAWERVGALHLQSGKAASHSIATSFSGFRLPFS